MLSTTTARRLWRSRDPVICARRRRRGSGARRDRRQEVVSHYRNNRTIGAEDEEEAARARDQTAAHERRRRDGALVPKRSGAPNRLDQDRGDRSAVVAPDSAHDQTATTSKFWGVNVDKSKRRWRASYTDADGKRASSATSTRRRRPRCAGQRGDPPRWARRKRRTNPVVDGALACPNKVPRPRGSAALRKKRRRDEPAAGRAVRARPPPLGTGEEHATHHITRPSAPTPSRRADGVVHAQPRDGGRRGLPRAPGTTRRAAHHPSARARSRTSLTSTRPPPADELRRAPLGAHDLWKPRRPPPAGPRARAPWSAASRRASAASLDVEAWAVFCFVKLILNVMRRCVSPLLRGIGLLRRRRLERL